MSDLDAEDDTGAPRQARLLAVAGVTLVTGVLLALVGGDTLLQPLGVYLASSVAFAVALIAGRVDRALPAAILVGILLLVGDAVQRRDLDEPFQQRHDGAVVATEAAARLVLEGHNPYTTDLTSALRPHHHTLDAVDNPIENPIVEHYPYLPAAFLVHVPFVAISDASGDWYDARMLYVALVAAALWFVASGTRPAWRRGAAVWALVGSGAVAVYLSWGANDAAAASLVVMGAALATRRPALAGVALALAISFKALLVVALIPLLALWLLTSRKSVLPLMAAAMATGLATTLPFLVASPGALIDDTVRFNLGLTDRAFPASGIGLGYLMPNVFSGWLLLVTSAVLVAGASFFAVWWVTRRPHWEVALFGAGLIVLAGLVPARTFQLTYAPLMVILWAPIWRLPREDAVPFDASRHALHVRG